MFPRRKGNQFKILEFQDSQTSHSGSGAAGIRLSQSDRMVQSRLPERMCIYVKEGEHDLHPGSPVSELFSPLSVQFISLYYHIKFELKFEFSSLVVY